MTKRIPCGNDKKKSNSRSEELAGMTPFNVDMPAAKQDVDGLKDAIQKAVRCGIHGANAFKFFLDEVGTFLTHDAMEVALTLFFGTAGNLGARMAQMKADGAALLGHR
jgi:hypothetical protein